MAQMLDNIIVAAVPDVATYSVAVTWADGEITIHCFRHLLGKGVCAALGDPGFFAQVRVGERGRSLAWPDEVDFCADALWFAAHPAEAPAREERQAAG